MVLQLLHRTGRRRRECCRTAGAAAQHQQVRSPFAHRAGASPHALQPQQPDAQETLYALLESAPGATPAELRRAYLRRVMAAHPDKGGCPERFRALQQAYVVLSDPAQRAAYDEKLGLAVEVSAAGIAGTAAAAAGGGRVVRSGGGVTVVVHGQTGPSRPPGEASAGAAAAAGAAAGAASGDGKQETAGISSSIDALLQQLRGEGGAIAAQRAALQHELAELYVQRAAAHQRRGRLHHALFDAQEAASLCPSYEAAAQLVAELEALVLIDPPVGCSAAAAGSGIGRSSSQLLEEDSSSEEEEV